MSANTKIVVLRRKELLYTGIFAALGVLFVILLLMLLLPGKAADTSGAPDSPDSTAETVMPDNVADLGRIPQSAQTEDVSTGAVADTDAVLDNASGPVGTANTYIPGIYTTELILGSETVNVEVIVNDHAITSLSLADPDETLTTMYPLLQPTMDSLSEQICETQARFSGTNWKACFSGEWNQKDAFTGKHKNNRYLCFQRNTSGIYGITGEFAETWAQCIPLLQNVKKSEVSRTSGGDSA